jgi:YidC/Oxa1 family membrane protein insertase
MKKHQVCRSLLLPLSVQQSKGAEYMRALKPYVAEIKAKFKDNKDAINRATAKLYEDAEQNPLAGCGVSLAQLPIFLGLYRGVRLLAVDGVLQEPFLWIPSLEGPVSPPDYRGMDWLLKGWHFDAGTIPEPSLGWETTAAFLVMPCVLVLLQTLTMRTLQAPIDENASDEERETLERTQGFLKFLPLMIGFFALQVPAGLTIYWFTSNLFTLSSTLAVKTYYAANPPKITLPDYWETALAKDKDPSEMTPEERRAAAEAGIRVGPSYDDYVDEARFHPFIERGPIRENSSTWERIVKQQQQQQSSSSSSSALAHSQISMIPELQAWVAAASPWEEKERTQLTSEILEAETQSSRSKW